MAEGSFSQWYLAEMASCKPGKCLMCGFLKIRATGVLPLPTLWLRTQVVPGSRILDMVWYIRPNTDRSGQNLPPSCGAYWLSTCFSWSG